MEKHVRALRALGILLFGLAILAMLWQTYRLLAWGVGRVQTGLLLASMVCVPLAAGAFVLARSFADETNRRRVVRGSVMTLFVFYLITLFVALIASRINPATFAADVAFYRANVALMTNFIPFATVRLYWRALIYNYIGPVIPLSNLIGNVLLFMPMAVFLPCLFPSTRKPWRFIVLMLAVLMAVESLQLILCCGSCDIDDVLLNLMGTVGLYFLLRAPAIERLLRALCLLPEEGRARRRAAPSPADAEVPATDG